jgi:hypothetical protein
MLVAQLGVDKMVIYGNAQCLMMNVLDNARTLDFNRNMENHPRKHAQPQCHMAPTLAN